MLKMSNDFRIRREEKVDKEKMNFGLDNKQLKVIEKENGYF